MSLDSFWVVHDTGQKVPVDVSMSYEALRLASFKARPRQFITSASRLANAGFYYKGPDSASACYKCKVVVDDWDSLGVTVDPKVVHAARYPECEFINNKAKDNVPYTSSHKLEELPIKISPRAKPTRSFQQEFVKTEMQNGVDIQTDSSSGGSTTTTSAGNVAPSAVSNTGNNTTTGSGMMSSGIFGNLLGGLFGGASNQASYLASNSTGFGNPPAIRTGFGDLYNGNHEAPHQLPLVPPTPRDPEPARDPEPPAPKDYKKEEVRRESYRYWTHAHTLSPAEMAKAGFYFIGTEDRVQCAFCKGILRNWEPSDNAMEEHKKHFPSCPFVKDSKSSGNVASAPEVSGVNFRKGMNSDTSPEDFQLGIMSQSAYRPDLAVKVERMNTFVNFNSDSVRKPEEFAEAGFYFTGSGDNVKCFFCDGGLRNWERNDDPWLEHARWFPKCNYLRMKKGEAYVKDIRKRYAPPGTRKPRLRRLKQRYTVTASELNEAIGKDFIQDVINMGFAESKVRQATQKRLEELGSNFPNLESVVDMIGEQDAMQQVDNIDCWTDEESEEEIELSGEFMPLPAPGTTPNFEVSKTKGNKGQKKKKAPKNKNKKTSEAVAEPKSEPMDYMSEEKGEELADTVQKMKDERMCKVCMDTDVNIVFLKCGHLVCCSDCAPALSSCPICRQVIRGTIRVFL